MSRVVGSPPRRSINGGVAAQVANNSGGVVASIATDLSNVVVSPTPYNGHFKRIVLYPYAANDAQLQELAA